MPDVFYFDCPYVEGRVELSAERERHIAARHPDLLPACQQLIGDTLAAPDQVRRSARMSSVRLFSRRFDWLRGGKHLVVVVVSDPGSPGRHWIITAYMARRIAEGEMEWKRA